MRFFKYNKYTNSFYMIDYNNNSIIPYILWTLTDKCLLTCPFCFQTKSNLDFDIKKLEEYIILFKQFGVQKIDLSGGEPLLYKHLPLIVKKLKDTGIYLTLTTTAYGLKHIKGWLLENNNIFERLIFSLNGFDEETHDNLCGKKGCYASLIEFIRQLKSNKYKNIRLNTVVTPLLKEYSNRKRIFETVQEIEPSEWCLIQPHPENKKQKFEDYSLSISDFNEVCSEIKKFNEKNDDQRIVILTRDNNDYNGYWVLYPNGRLRIHSIQESDFFEVEFNNNAIPLIILHLEKLQYTFPDSPKI